MPSSPNTFPLGLHTLPLGLLDRAWTQVGPTSSFERVAQHTLTHASLINESSTALTNFPTPADSCIGPACEAGLSIIDGEPWVNREHVEDRRVSRVSHTPSQGQPQRPRKKLGLSICGHMVWETVIKFHMVIKLDERKIFMGRCRHLLGKIFCDTNDDLWSVCSNNVAHICSIARLAKRAAPLINLSIAQHLTNCTIFCQSHSTLATALVLGLKLKLGLGLWLGFR